MKDIIIIGAGPGGYELALEAAKKGLNVTLIEKENVGGTCLNHGCIPTKSYYQNAKLLNELAKKESFGINGEFSFDFLKAFERKEKVVSNLIDGINFLLKKANVEMVYGSAKLISKNEVLVNDTIYEAKYIVIATGSSPIRLNLEGFNLENVVTSEELLSMKKLPKHLTVIGGGVIGIEMGTIFQKFGSTVEIIEMAPTILPLLDNEISKRLQSYLKQQGIKLHTNSKVTSISKNDDLLQINFLEKDKVSISEADVCLLSIGRAANVNGLGLDEVGIEYNHKQIIVNEDFRTNISNIFAIGDVTGKTMLAHAASYSGFHVLNTIVLENRAEKNVTNFSNINFGLVPSCVFTFPEIASIGLTEEEANSKGINYKVNKAMYRSNGKALAMDEIDGFVKIIIFNDEIIGVHIIGYDASVIIHEALPIMNEKIKLTNIKDYIHAHPTLSEVFASAIRE